MATWVMAPDITSAPDKWLAGLGPRYTDENWALELEAGTYIQAQRFRPLLNVWAKWDASETLTTSLDLMWIDYHTGRNSVGYVLWQINYRLLPELIMLGAETEDTFGRRNTLFAAGPNVTFLFDRLAIAFAYQFRNRSQDAVWIRIALS